MTGYAELQATSNYSFLRGGSHPGELVLGAEALGLKAIGIADRNTLAGVVRAWTEAKGRDIRALTGARLDFVEPFPSLIVYPTDRAAYGRLSRLLTLGQRRAEKGDCHLFWRDFLEAAEGQVVLVAPPAKLDETFGQDLRRIARELRGNVWLAAARGYGAQDLRRLSQLDALARASGAPMCAVGDVLYHGPERRPLQDVLTCIREGCTITEAGLRLEANAERCLKSPQEMARLFKPWPGALDVSLEIAGRIGFDLGQIAYQYPDEPVPEGWTAMAWLTELTWRGAKWRYPDGVRADVRQTIESELKLIGELGYPHYFLTVHDIVRWAREQDILCQGRGSAANSVVCFCLGVTAVDPTKPDQDLLFARFLSKERDEPPDIDVDFEHERREEVMQYIYQRYGRDRAAICATVIHYRPRSAIRDVGKALGLTEDITAALAGTVWGSWGSEMPEDQIRQAGLDPTNPEIARAVGLAEQIMGFPRHLSQHVGGYVLTQTRLDETVPIGNAAMEDRTFIEWDKDDIDSVGLMKVDILALGMLTCIKRALNFLGTDHGFHYGDIAEIPQECPAVYEMLSRADSVGVFQVESRAQMSMLPRLRPRKFYDLVIEVAIVRPGPIQGDMVHPYLKRRNGQEPVDFPRPSPEHGPPDELKSVLGKTYGVPLFQEQAMRLAIEAARFTPEEANGLRRAMATFRSDGTLWTYKTKFVEGMTRRGYEREFAERCFKQIEGFGSYGFPESHAISFAILVYVSAWLKCWWPDVFCAAIINSLPMGFYQPAQLVRDARDHGVEVRAADVLHSDWDCTLEDAGAPSRPGWENGQRLPGYKAVRLGLRQVKGLKEPEIEAIMQARKAGPVADLADLARRARLSQRGLELLAEADAFRSLGLDRRAALWAVKGMAGEGRVERDAPLLAGLSVAERQPDLPGMGLAEHVAEDYRTTSLSLKAHPVSFFRARLQRMGCVPCDALSGMRNGQKVKIGGLVLIRQRPGTAKGVVFVTLEDETGPANAVVWQDRFTANRRVVMSSSFLVVEGRLQIAEGVIHVVAEKFHDLSAELAEMREEGRLPAPSQEIRQRLVKSRDFH